MRERSFWAGFVLGVSAGAVGLYAGLRAWAGQEPEDEPEDEPENLEIWCPGTDPLPFQAAWPEPDYPVRWELCRWWPSDHHGIHRHWGDADREPNVWCPGTPDPEWSTGKAVLAAEHGITGWEECSATIKHRPHCRWDLVTDDDPEERDLYGEPNAWEFPEDDSVAGEDTQASDDVEPTLVDHAPWIPTPLVGQADREKIRAAFDEVGRGIRRAFTVLPPPANEASCDRDWPHPVHVHTGGVCQGRATPGTTVHRLERHMGLVADYTAWCGKWHVHDAHSYMTGLKVQALGECVGVRRG